MAAQKLDNESRKFSNKWSPAIQDHGYTNIPNLLLVYRKALGITPSEFIVIVAIESFRWDNRRPYPSLEAISKRACLSRRRTRAVVETLEGKGYVKRTRRTGQTNLYNIEWLIHRLDQFATSSLPQGKKEPPRWAETRLEQGLTLASKQDTTEQHTLKAPTIKTAGKNGLSHISRIIKPP